MSEIKNQIKKLLLEKNLTMTQLVQLLNEKYNRSDSIQNLNNKLSKETIKHTEILEIADVLNYSIKWEPRDSIDATSDMRVKERLEEYNVSETVVPEALLFTKEQQEKIRKLLSPLFTDPE